MNRLFSGRSDMPFALLLLAPSLLLPAAQAMANADDLIKSYVAAGFKKIHLDCSMSCQDDPIPLTDDIVADPRPIYSEPVPGESGRASMLPKPGNCSPDHLLPSL